MKTELDSDPEAVTVNPDLQQDTSSTPLEDRAGGKPKGSDYDSRGTKRRFRAHPFKTEAWTRRRNHQSSKRPFFNKKVLKKHKDAISTRSKSKKAKRYTKQDREERQILH